MQVEVEEIDPCVRRLTIEVEADKVDRELGQVYNNLQKRVRFPGFRQGKVPRRMLENQYRHSAEHEVLQKLVSEALSAALVDKALRYVGEPQIDPMTLSQAQPFRFVATVQIIPDFDIADYHAWTFERRLAPVHDDDIDKALDRVRGRHAALETVAGRPAQEGDFVIIDYQGTLDERPLEGAKGTNVSLEVGAGMFFPEIEQCLVGMTQGAQKTILVSFPDDYQEPKLAGQTANFQVSVSEIKEKILPELDDEFAQAYEEADSLAALRARLREELEETARQNANAVLHNEILAELVKANPIEAPDILVEEQMRRMYLRHKQQEMGQELTDEDYHVDVDSLREAYAEAGLEAVQGQLILSRVGEEAGVEVRQEEIDTEVASLASRMGQNPEALKQAMERNGTLSALESGLRQRRIFEVIMANVQITDKVVAPETLTPEA
ncbi:MAG: trigger factor [bacterium]|nr:trigger factor [bacterium]